MSGVRNVLAIAQREIKSYFVSPVAYVVATVFLLLFGILILIVLKVSRKGILGYLLAKAAR